jgi:hypothetical protein
VKLDVSGVDGELILSGDFSLVELDEIIENWSSKVGEFLPGISLLVSSGGSLELVKGLTGEAKLTPLEDVRFIGRFLNTDELLLKSFNGDVCSFRILHPVDGEKISEA